MWVIKAINLNRGMCIRIVDSYEQMVKVLEKFKLGVDYNFTKEKTITVKPTKANEKITVSIADRSNATVEGGTGPTKVTCSPKTIAVTTEETKTTTTTTTTKTEEKQPNKEKVTTKTTTTTFI